MDTYLFFPLPQHISKTSDFPKITPMKHFVLSVSDFDFKYLNKNWLGNCIYFRERKGGVLDFGYIMGY
jgi:hypothetical protein